MKKKNAYELAFLALFVAKYDYHYAIEILELKLAKLQECAEENAEDIARFSGAIEIAKSNAAVYEGTKAGLL